MNFISNEGLALQLKKSKSWGPFKSYQLNITDIQPILPDFLVNEWAKLAVLFSWLLQSGHEDFDFFNFFTQGGCQIFILCEIHFYLYPPKSSG